MKVLVTGAGALLGQGIIRAVKHSTLRADVIAVDPSDQAVGLHWADRAHVILPAANPAFLDRFREVLAEEGPDVVLVGTDVELPIFARNRALLEGDFGCRIVVSEPEAIDIANDKWLTFRFLEKHDLPRPLTCLPGDEEQLLDQVGFPLVVKPRVGARSVGVQLVRDRAELADAIARHDGLVIQECVGTPEAEYTAGVVYFDGQSPVSIVMRRDLRDGNTYRAFVVSDAGLNEYVRRVAAVFRPFGPVNFQFRLADEVPKIFEINCRFSGTTPMRARAGFNEVEIVIRYLLERAPLSQPAVAGVSFFRYWDDLLVPTAVAPGSAERKSDPT